MAESRMTNTIKNSFASLALKVVGIFTQFAIRTAYIYILGNEYTGVAGLFTDILQVLSLMEMGLDVSMVYAMYKPLAEKDSKRIAALMNFYSKAFTVIGVGVLVAGAICIPFLDNIVKGVPNIQEDIRVIFAFYVSTTAVSYFFVYRTIVLNADQKSRIVSKWNAIIRILETILEIIFLLVFRRFYAYLIVHFFAVVLTNIVLSYIATKMYPDYFNDKEAKLEKHETITLFRDIACMMAYDVSGVVINSTDSIFISAFVGTVEVAIIGNYAMLINSIKNATAMFLGAAKPSIGNLALTSTKEKQRDVFEKMNFMTFYIACFCTTCLFNLLTPFIGDIWLNGNYKVSQGLVTLMCVNFFISEMVLPIGSFRTANGLFVQGWGRPLLTAGLNILLDFVMGSRWGIVGIFLATTISRVGTQVWFDPYILYKWVLKDGLAAYFKELLWESLFTVGSCAVTWYAIHLACAGLSAKIAFVVTFVIAIIMPLLLMNIAFRKNSRYLFMMEIVKKMILKIKRQS